MDNIKICCPKCEWEPNASSRWRCSCGHSWNTFDTGGRCPACKKVWEETQCHASKCHQWSPHLDWYRGLEDVVKLLKEEIKHSWQEVG